MSDGTLRRTLGLGDAVVIGAGSMVGAGVFAAWGPAAAAAGGGLLLGLVIAGIVAFCNATSSAQLAACHPESGGTYVYARVRLGPAWGHLAGWGFVVGKIASCVAMAHTVGAYLWPEQATVVAVAAVLAILLVNLGGLSRTATVTRWLLVISLGALAVVVVAGWSAPGTSPSRIDPFATTPWGVLRSAGLLFFAFAGYARIATLGEEVVDPERTIPKAIPRALGLVLILYAVVGLTLLAAVPVTQVADSDAALRLVVGGGWAPVVRVGAGIAALGVLLNLLPGISRTVLAMARRRELPQAFAAVSARRGLPVRAETAVAAAVAGLAAIVDLTSAIALSGVAVLTYYALTNAAALRLAPGERRWPRWIAWLGLAGCVLLVTALPPRAILIGSGVLLAGVLVRQATLRIGS